MSKFEKLGNFLLFEKIEEDRLSKNFLAGQIANNQIQQVLVVKKFDHSLSTLPDLILDLNQEYEILKQLANPSIIRPSAFVQERSEFAAIFDYWEGKSLRAVLNRCGQEGYPFTADHALLIASRLCTAIEYLHSKKVDDRRLVHGFVCPENVFVSYDGEIKLQYFGLAHALLRFPAGREKLLHDFKNYMPPEIMSHQKLDRGSDIFGVGLVMFEMLTGEPYYSKGRDVNVTQAVEQAQMNTNSGDRVPLPDEVKKVLLHSLAQDPSHRYSSIGEMRKALDQLLFANEFSPNTFNLAFFMNSLFRDSIDEESKNIKNLKKMDVTSYVKEEPPPPPKPEHPVGAEAAKDVPSISMGLGRDSGPTFGQPEVLGGVEPKEKSNTPLAIGAVVLLAVVGTIGYLFLKPSGTQAPAQGQVAGLTVQQQKTQEAERLRFQMEAEKAQEEAKKKDEALKELQAKLDTLLKQQQDSAKKAATAPSSSGTPVVDTKAAIEQLQEQARRLEEERRQQQTLAEEKLRAAQSPPPAVTSSQQQPQQQEGGPTEKVQQMTAAAQPPVLAPEEATQTPGEQKSVQEPAGQPAATGPVAEGQEVELTPDVVKPELVNRVNPTYPNAARMKRVEGTVILSLLVSENGDVANVKVLRGAGGSSGLNEAAVSSARKWKFRPAVKEGKRVRVWVTYPIVFKLQ